MEIITYEYIPNLERYAYLKYEAIINKQSVDGINFREWVWGRWSWGDTNVGPWNEFKYFLFGGLNQ